MWNTPIIPIHEQSRLLLGRVELRADAEAWHAPCISPSRPSIAFPRFSVATHAEGTAGERIITPNHAIFANPNWPYTRRPLSPQGEYSFVIAPHTDDLREMVTRCCPASYEHTGNLFDLGDAPVSASTMAASCILEHHAHQPDADPQALREFSAILIERALTDAYTQDPRPKPTFQSVHDDRVHAAAEFLARHPDQIRSLDELGDHVHMSPLHFCRVFRQHTGMTVHTYQTQLRLRAAARSITQSDTRLARIAHEFAFSDQAHLTRACKSSIGLTPGALRGCLRDSPQTLMLLTQLLKN